MPSTRCLLALSALVLSSAFVSAKLGDSVSTQRTFDRASVRSPFSRGNNRLGNTALNAVEAKASTPVVRGGDATIAASTFNLAKSIIGAGVLTLPSGVAFLSDSPVALIPAIAILVFSGLLSAYSFSLIGKSCEQHGVGSYQEAWEKSGFTRSGWVVSGSVTASCFICAVAFSIIIGDSFASMASTFNLPSILAQRTNIILLLTTFVLYPLFSLKSLSALAPFSLLGLGGTLYTAIVMAVRYFDKSYAVGGEFYKALAAEVRPKFGKTFGGLSPKTFVLLSMLAASFNSHFSAPSFYRELKNNTMARYNRVTALAFGASMLLFTVMMSLGFLTFGGSTAGFVLNNYASSDSLITIARLAVGLSIITGYPFIFRALTEGVLDMMKVSEPQKRSSMQGSLTLSLLAVVTFLSIILKDVGFVVSVSGAGFGSALMLIFPAMMNIRNIKAKAAAEGKKGRALTKTENVEIVINHFITATGYLLAVLGVGISVLKEMKKL